VDEIGGKRIGPTGKRRAQSLIGVGKQGVKNRGFLSVRCLEQTKKGDEVKKR